MTKFKFFITSGEFKPSFYSHYGGNDEAMARGDCPLPPSM
jgi:hypothetical protein